LIGTGGEGDGESRVVFTGLEVVRRDWTDLARQAQRELFERLFRDRPVEGYLEELVRRLRAGELDELLVYRKSLRKEPGEYTATTPPHVVAARKLSGRPQRRIAYVMTVAGPEPASERAHELDHQHYVDRQLRPVAEPILAELGLDFDRVIGDDRQIDLF
jgi:DNA polymerase-2